MHYSITAELSHDVYQIVTFEKTLNYFDLASDKNRNNGPQTKRHFAYTQTCFLSWHAAKSFIKNLTLESFIPTSMLSINKKTMRLGVTSIASKVPDILGDTGSWRHLPRHLVRFSHAFPLDSFSRAA